MTLRNRAKKVDPRADIVQRIKRRSSIEQKLRLYHGMDLARMQDIGGCRAVVRTVRTVDRLLELYAVGETQHELLKQDDYIWEKPGGHDQSGYRGVHLIYKYWSDKKPEYNGLRIEVQMRSKLQHAWATTVETVGTFTRQALKSSRGEADWLRFFALMGSALALREKTPLVPGTPTTRAKKSEKNCNL